MACVPCRGGVPPLSHEEIEPYLADLGNEWRVVEDHHLEKEYRFANFREALAFTNRVGELAEEVGHHPDIELAWGRVEADGLHAQDRRPARGRLRLRREGRPGVVSLRFREIVIDCADPRSLARFWAQTTGYRLEQDHDDWASVVGEGDRAIIIAFQQVPESKEVTNRVHVDLSAADIEAEAQRVEALGATRRWVSDDPDDPFIVLADPEDNEFCIVLDPEAPAP